MRSLDERKILLVHPLGYHAVAAATDISRIANVMPPLGLASIAAYLEAGGFHSEIVDCYAQPDSDRVIRDYLLREKPAFMGLSCTTSSFLDGVRIAELAKDVLPNLRVIVGGPHASALKREALEMFPAVDFGVVGEGEATLKELLQSAGEGAHSLKGLVYREVRGEVCFSGYRESGIELDRLPFPAYEKLLGYPETYTLPIFNYPKAPNSSCITSRGCPYACSYCDRSVFRRSFRYNSAEYVYEHLRYLRERFHIRHVNFYDDQFTFNRKRVVALTQMMIDRPLGLTFNCAVRAEHIDWDLLLQMKAAGCWMISLGIETGDEELLAYHRQNADLELLAHKIRLIKRAGIRTKGLLMMGLPGETESSIRKSMQYVFSLPIDDFNLAKFTPFPGSPLYRHIHRFGEFEEEWQKMDCMHFVFITKGMVRERLEELFKAFYKRHYLRLKVLWGFFCMLWRSPDSWMRFLYHWKSFFKFIRSDKRLQHV